MSSDTASATQPVIGAATAELLRQLDARAAKFVGRPSDKRERERKICRLACDIRYFQPGTERIRTTRGTTRDLSAGGLGFVSPQHFIPRTELLVTVTTPDGTRKRLPGVVQYSRPVSDDVFHTGMKFSAIDQRLLAGDATGGTDRTDKTPTHARPPVAAPAPSVPSDTGGTTTAKPRESSATTAVKVSARVPPGRTRELQVLAAAASCAPSKELASKVIMLSMSPDHEVRRASIPVLMRLVGDDGALSIMVLLDDANSAVRCDAVDALGQLRCVQAVGKLQELLSDNDSELALRAAGALGAMGDTRGLKVVARIVRGDDPLNRRAARTLGLIVGSTFRPNREGVEAARKYLKSRKI